jgi:hypothetical protein
MSSATGSTVRHPWCRHSSAVSSPGAAIHARCPVPCRPGDAVVAVSPLRPCHLQVACAPSRFISVAQVQVRAAATIRSIGRVNRRHRNTVQHPPPVAPGLRCDSAARLQRLGRPACPMQRYVQRQVAPGLPPPLVAAHRRGGARNGDDRWLTSPRQTAAARGQGAASTPPSQWAQYETRIVRVSACPVRRAPRGALSSCNSYSADGAGRARDLRGPCCPGRGPCRIARPRGTRTSMMSPCQHGGRRPGTRRPCVRRPRLAPAQSHTCASRRTARSTMTRPRNLRRAAALRDRAPPPTIDRSSALSATMTRRGRRTARTTQRAYDTASRIENDSRRRTWPRTRDPSRARHGARARLCPTMLRSAADRRRAAPRGRPAVPPPPARSPPRGARPADAVPYPRRAAGGGDGGGGGCRRWRQQSRGRRSVCAVSASRAERGSSSRAAHRAASRRGHRCSPAAGGARTAVPACCVQGTGGRTAAVVRRPRFANVGRPSCLLSGKLKTALRNLHVGARCTDWVTN